MAGVLFFDLVSTLPCYLSVVCCMVSAQGFLFHLLLLFLIVYRTYNREISKRRVICNLHVVSRVYFVLFRVLCTLRPRSVLGNVGSATPWSVTGQ